MGINAIYAEEKPSRRVHVAAFCVQVHEVTNPQFERFVAATGYVTDAERSSQLNTTRGGSFPCAESYCARYRTAVRQGQEVDFSSNRIGFRIVKNSKSATP